MNYGLYKKWKFIELNQQQNKKCVNFILMNILTLLVEINPDNLDLFTKEQIKFNVGDDCPVFDGLFEYCGISGGGSMERCRQIESW